MFYMNTYLMASAGKWDLLAQYYALTAQIMAAKEVVIIPGSPKDKEQAHG